jgi:hypothetical protein
MTQKITMGRDRRQDAIDAENAMRQSGHNAYVNGIPSVGDRVSQSRSRFGAPTVMPQELSERNSNFSSTSTAANVPLDDPMHSTGNVDLQTSATRSAEKDPAAFQGQAMERAEDEKLQERLDMYAGKVNGNAHMGNNNRPQTQSL